MCKAFVWISWDSVWDSWGISGNRVASAASERAQRASERSDPTWREICEILTRFPFTYLDRFLGTPFSFYFLVVFSWWFRNAFWCDLGVILGSFFQVFFMCFPLKNDRFFNAFWDAFWMNFGGPDPRKWSSRVHETLILTKSPFSSQGHFLM